MADSFASSDAVPSPLPVSPPSPVSHLPIPTTSIFLHPLLLIPLSIVFAKLVKLVPAATLAAFVTTVLHRPAANRQKDLKRELFETRQQLAQTSSQDQFAKWAKLKRKVDKTLADLEAINRSLASSQSTLTMLFKAGLFAASTLLPFAISTYFRKTPIFWLPPAGSRGGGEDDDLQGWKGKGAMGDWLGPLGWALSLPSAPRGSVSATVWSQVCGRVLDMVITLLKDFSLASISLEERQPAAIKTFTSRYSALTQTAWYVLALSSCTYAFSQFDQLSTLTGFDIEAQFGGHYQFLTNLGLAATWLTLVISLVSLGLTALAFPTGILAPVRQLKALLLTIALPVETLISILYWSILTIDPKLLMPTKQVADPSNPGQFIQEMISLPLKVDLALHATPAIWLLVTYLLFSPPFSTSATPYYLSSLSTLAYGLWVEVCAAHNGHYPYPLLNILTQEKRVALYFGCAMILVGVLRGLRWAKEKIEGTTIAATTQKEKVGPISAQAHGSSEKREL